MTTESKRQREAQRELTHTAVAPATAWALLAGALLPLLLVSAARLGEEVARAPFTAFAPALPGAVAVLGTDGPVAADRTLLAAMETFETALEETSPLRARTLPVVQWLLTTWGGVGNETVYVGREGWLFYRPGVDYVTGPPFLDPQVLRRRALAGPSWEKRPQPDPRPALLDLAQQLRARDIDLLVLPVPSKAMIEPGRFAAGAVRTGITDGALHNPSFAAFRADLEAAGIAVFDPTPLLLTRQAAGQETFLHTDSHWHPAAMDAVAAAVAARLEGKDTGPPQAWTRRSHAHQAQGDLATLLRLPPEQERYPPETVSLLPVTDEAGTPWAPDPAAAVLLLGDSFTNVFSQDDLGWGTGAGLAEQLSYHLGRGVDRIALNDGGATGSRRALARQLAGGEDRLAGKRVVVYQLAVRELAGGDWQLVPLPTPPSGEPAATPAGSGEEQRIRGRLRAVAALPAPGTTPYREALVALHLEAVETLAGPAVEKEILVYTWGLRDGRPTAAATLTPGERLTLTVVPWRRVEDDLGGLQRLELTDAATFTLDAYWSAAPR